MNLAGQPLPVWQVEIDDAGVDPEVLDELMGGHEPDKERRFDVATVLYRESNPAYDAWTGNGEGRMNWPLSLDAGGCIAVRLDDSRHWRHYFFVVEVSPHRAVLLQTSKLPADWPGLTAIQKKLRSEGVRFQTVDPAVRFEFIAGKNGNVVALVQPAFTRYGIRCKSCRPDAGRSVKTSSDTASREDPDIRPKAMKARLNRFAGAVERVLDGVLAQDPSWMPKARRFEAYFQSLTPWVEPWLQQQLIDATVQPEEAKPAELLAGTPQAEDAATQLRSNHERALKRRLETTKAKAEAHLQLVPVPPPRKWKIHDDGIYVEGPWDEILGSRFREIRAKWLRPGWRLSLHHAQAIAELFRDLPQLRTQHRKLSQQLQEMKASVPVPSGYQVDLQGMNIQVRGGGNRTLDAQLTNLLGAGKTYDCDCTVWTVRPEQLPELKEILKQHPPSPKPPQACKT